MGTHRVRSWVCVVASLSLWSLLMSSTAHELYEEVLPEDYPTRLQDENSLDTSPMRKRTNLQIATDNILLYKLLQLQANQREESSRNRNSDPTLSDWPTDYQERLLGYLTEKDRVIKRFTNAARGREKNVAFRSTNEMYRPQQKWKIKKGKSFGSPMVCYFKLCAFRSPV